MIAQRAEECLEDVVDADNGRVPCPNPDCRGGTDTRFHPADGPEPCWRCDGEGSIEASTDLAADNGERDREIAASFRGRS